MRTPSLINNNGAGKTVVHTLSRHETQKVPESPACLSSYYFTLAVALLLLHQKVNNNARFKHREHKSL
jgi:hypothetical protein